MAATPAAAGGRSRGGRGRGQGRRSVRATPVVRPAGPSPGDNRVQQSLSELLGVRTPAPRASVLAADVIKWDAGEDMDVPQKQVKGGAVRYELDEGTEYEVLQVGSTETEETVYVDGDGNLVSALHPRAERKTRHAHGHGSIQIRPADGETDKWVGARHVFALQFGPKRQRVDDVLGRRREDDGQGQVAQAEAAAQRAAAAAMQCTPTRRAATQRAATRSRPMRRATGKSRAAYRHTAASNRTPNLVRNLGPNRAFESRVESTPTPHTPHPHTPTPPY